MTEEKLEIFNCDNIKSRISNKYVAINVGYTILYAQLTIIIKIATSKDCRTGPALRGQVPHFGGLPPSTSNDPYHQYTTYLLPVA